MPKVRGLLNAAVVETAKRKRICHRSRRQHEILAGERCLVIKDTGTGGTKNYCLECATEILHHAKDDLEALRAGLIT